MWTIENRGWSNRLLSVNLCKSGLLYLIEVKSWLQSQTLLVESSADGVDFEMGQIFEIKIAIILGPKHRGNWCMRRNSCKLGKVVLSPISDKEFDLPPLFDINYCQTMNDVKTESSALLPNIQGIKIHIEIFPGNRQLLNRINEFGIFLPIIVGFLEDVDRAICSNCILRCRLWYKSDWAIVKVSREYG